jgi:Histidine kinase-, DNA gyrase B-, and HSP90-like ATPase
MACCRYPIVSEHNFLVATRDAGYRNLATALAELLDNSIQAGATLLRIAVEGDTPFCSQIAVLDDGRGMDAAALQTALQFGGSSRFNDRSGQGRFGMGLPNSSFSQARRVEVYSWKALPPAHFSYLDLDDVAGGRIHSIPRPQTRPLPAWAVPHAHRSGTLVIWKKCDRVPLVERPMLLEHLQFNFAQIYRYHLWDGLRIVINDQDVLPIDPLLCHPQSTHRGATEFQEPLVYTMKVPREPRRTAQVRVRFAEFSVAKWRDLSSAEKRLRRITRHAGVSIIRGKREVAYGWFFMGAKRKENYDDWWRCEITFDAELDEYFGVTNTKQQISPIPELEETLSRDLEPIARLLNSRVRSSFQNIRSDSRAARVAGVRDRLLPPAASALSHSLPRVHARTSIRENGLRYKIEEVASSDDAFYSFRFSGRKLILVLNTNHPFYNHVFHDTSGDVRRQRYHLECLLLALVRAEADAKTEQEIDYSRRKRVRWSNVLASFLGN